MNHRNVLHTEVARTVRDVLLAHGFVMGEVLPALHEVMARCIARIEGRWAGPVTLRDWQELAFDVALDYAAEKRPAGKATPGALGGVRATFAAACEPGDPADLVTRMLFKNPRDRAAVDRQIAVIADMRDHDEIPPRVLELLGRMGNGESLEKAARRMHVDKGEAEAWLREVRTRFFRRVRAADALAAGIEAALEAGLDALEATVARERA